MPHLICYYLVFAQQVGFHVSSFHLLAYTNIAFHKGFTLIYIFWNIVENHQTWFELLGFNASWIHYEKLHLSKPYYLVIKTQKKFIYKYYATIPWKYGVFINNLPFQKIS
jgi:hypothetical protein